MRAFKVRLNGKRVCVAGIKGDCVANVNVTHVVGYGRNELYLFIGGLMSATEEHVRWKVPTLKVGDLVSIKVVETDTADAPVQRYRSDSKESEQNAKAYAQAQAKKYGWKLLTRPLKKSK
jgi:hypothetical protein